MRKILYKIGTVLTGLACALTICSCGEDEAYDIRGEVNNKVYISNPGSRNFSVLHTPLVSVGIVSLELPVYCTHQAKGDISVTLSVDNSLVGAYNKEHGTTYGEISESSIVVENNSVKIPANALQSELKSRIFIKEEFLPTLKEYDNYIIPVKIVDVSGNASCSENVCYIVISISEDSDNLWESVTLASIDAKRIEDRSGWGGWAGPSGTTQTNSAVRLYDGITNKYREAWSVSIKNKSAYVVVDMAEVRLNMIGFELIGLEKDVAISVSVDNENWISIGKTINGSPALKASNVVFYAPLDVRYVKCEFPLVKNWAGTQSGAVLHEFYAYIK